MKMFYSPSEIQKLTGINAQKIRVNMSNGNWDLGAVIKKDDGEDKRNDYVITPYKLFKELGVVLPGYIPPSEENITTQELLQALRENTEALKELIAMGKLL